MGKPKLRWWKLITTKTFPNIFLLVGEEGETHYFQMKMLFFSYLFLLIFFIALLIYVVFSFNTSEHFFNTPDYGQFIK